MSAAAETVFLFDVDNTLLDNDRFQDDLRQEELDARPRRARLRALLADFRGAARRTGLRRLSRRPRTPENSSACMIPCFFRTANWLIDYPFADRLYPHVLKVVEHVRQWGTAGHSFRRRRHLPAAQDRPLRLMGCVRGQRPDLRAQGKGDSPTSSAGIPPRIMSSSTTRPASSQRSRRSGAIGSRPSFRNRATTLRRSRRATGRPSISRSTGSAICWAMICRS